MFLYSYEKWRKQRRSTSKVSLSAYLFVLSYKRLRHRDVNFFRLCKKCKRFSVVNQVLPNWILIHLRSKGLQTDSGTFECSTNYVSMFSCLQKNMYCENNLFDSEWSSVNKLGKFCSRKPELFFFFYFSSPHCFEELYKCIWEKL